MPRTESIVMEVAEPPFDPVAPNALTDLAAGSPSSTPGPAHLDGPG